MRRFKAENLAIARRNPNELWMAAKLKRTAYRWTPQATWGMRIFDFWCHELGIAVEVDGVEHETTRKEWDAFCDAEQLRRSAIVVLRVRNRNEADAAEALAAVAGAVPWKARREAMGVPVGVETKSSKTSRCSRRSNRPRVPQDPHLKATPSPQAVCSECHTRVRTRRPTGAVRCRCGKNAS